MDALYILGNGSAWNNNELRYSLRSLERFVTGIDRVIVAGVNPGFLSDEVVYYNVPEANGNREYRIAAKIYTVCNCFDISDDFFFLNDDYFFTAPVHAPDYPFYHKGDLNLPTFNKGYGRVFIGTRDFLHRNCAATLLNYDGHYPIIYNREKFLQLEWAWLASAKSKLGYTVKSVYGNLHGVDGMFMEDCKLRGIKGMHDVTVKTEGRHVYSIADEAVKQGVGAWLEWSFPDKSKYEV